MQDERPTSDQIARAFVLAAREMGDLPRLAAAVEEGPGAYRNLIIRARWVALDALLTLWPRFGVRRFAALLGSSLPNGAYTSMENARQSRWWSQAIVDRVIAGI